MRLQTKVSSSVGRGSTSQPDTKKFVIEHRLVCTKQGTPLLYELSSILPNSIAYSRASSATEYNLLKNRLITLRILIQRILHFGL